VGGPDRVGGEANGLDHAAGDRGGMRVHGGKGGYFRSSICLHDRP
jgi:hypothetical protein